MTATLDAVTKRKLGPELSAEQKLAQELVARAREQGVSLTGQAGQAAAHDARIRHAARPHLR